MNIDDFEDAWKKQPRPTIDADRLLEEVKRDERRFTAMIFRRDVREVATSLLMVPLWVTMGVKNGSPWTWYLTVPVLLWVAGYMVADRMRHRRRPPEPSEPLRVRVQGSLAEVGHQIRLLRSVFWWALLPMAVAVFAFIGQVALRERAGGWWMAVAFSGVVAIAVGVLGAIYGMNLYAVRADLEPRRRELEALLTSLEDESPVAG